MASSSNSLVLVRADLRQVFRRQRSLYLLIIFFAVLLLVSHAVIGAGVAKFSASMKGSSALNLIEISSFTSQATRSAGPSDLSEISAIPGVVEAYPWFQVDLALTDPEDWPDPQTHPDASWATPLIPGLEPELILGELPEVGIGMDDIILPHEVPGGTLDHLLGQTVKMEFTKVLSTRGGEPGFRDFRVVGIFDNSVPGKAGVAPSYVSQDALKSLYEESNLDADAPYPSVYVQVTDADQVATVQKALADQGFAVSSVAQQLKQLGGIFATLDAASTVLLVLLIVICLAVGGAAGAVWVQQRQREIGLLKAIGWSNGKIGRTFGLELAIAGVAVGVVAALLGCILSLFATTWIASAEVQLLPVSGWQLPPWSITLLVVFLVPLCLMLGTIKPGLKAARLDPDDALRDV